jgi:hypothetical protein
METKKVYIVTAGSYSDYHIESVFSTLEMAEEFADTIGSDYQIEKYNIDEPIERKISVWCISMNFDSQEVESADSYSCFSKDMVVYSRFRNAIDLFIESDAREKAVKIAHERLGMVKANEHIVFPYLRRKIVKDRYGFYSYPRYNFQTGEIILLSGEVLTENDVKTKQL